MASKKDKIEKTKNVIPTGQLLHKTVEEVIQPSDTEEIAKLRADIAKLRKDNQVLQEIVNKFFY